LPSCGETVDVLEMLTAGVFTVTELAFKSLFVVLEVSHVKSAID